MSDDAIQLLRDFRPDLPVPDEDTRQRAHAYAVGRTHAAARLRLRAPTTSRGRILAITVALSVAALIGFLAVPGSGSHHSTTPGGTTGPGGAGGVPPEEVPLGQALSDASKAFGAPLALPHSPLLGRPAGTAEEVWAPVPFPGGRIRLVQVALSYPDVSVTYAPTALTEPDARYPNALDQYRAAIARSTDPGAERIVHVSGTPALLSRSSTAIVIEFRLGALSIWISNSGSPPNLDAAAVEGFARSIVDRARASAFPTGWAVGGGLGALVLVGLVLTAWRRTLHAKRLRAG